MDARQEVRHYIMENILFGERGEFDDRTSFQESGIIDSTGFLELISFVEEKFEISATEDELVPENFDSVDRIATFVQAKLARKGA